MFNIKKWWKTTESPKHPLYMRLDRAATGPEEGRQRDDGGKTKAHNRKNLVCKNKIIPASGRLPVQCLRQFIWP